MILLSLSIIGEPKKACLQASKKVSVEENTLAELKQLREDLETRFQEYCKEDFSAQIEGIANEIHRNKAIKVAFAKRRLSKLIENKSRDIASSIDVYCTHCRSYSERDDLRNEYCQRCPVVCEAKKPR